MSGRLVEIVSTFLRLGLTSFGGPVAHLGYLRAECVERRAWLDDDAYADLVALCQFLPGPTSSQVVFALGMRRAGLAGALVASACFLAPSAAAMIAFAYGVAALGDVDRAGWVHGLKLAAVAVVAQAVWAMGRKLCPDLPRMMLALAAALATLLVPGALAQVLALAVGGVVAVRVYGSSPSLAEGPASGASRTRRGTAAAIGALASFAALLVAPRAIAEATGAMPAAVFDVFYRAGALVFGGGHVVLPLLRASIVPAGWLTDDVFLAGYGAAQAVPGPLFSLAGYLGAATTPGPSWSRGLLALTAIFLPGWLLVAGALPFWDTLRAKAWMQAALRGVNAAVVGILLGALCSPVVTEGVTGPRDVVAALVAFALLERWRAPPFVVVLACAATGELFARVG